MKAIKQEKRQLDKPSKRYLPTKESPRRSTKEDLVKELTLFKELTKQVKGKHSPRIERVVSLLEKAVEPEKKRKFVSFVDPEARFGRKNKGIKFAGYKAHIIEDESQIVTNVETIPGNENEGSEDLAYSQ